MFALDLTFINAIKLAIALVFIVGAIQKLKDIDTFQATVEAYDLLPQFLVTGFSIILPVVELVTACLLLVNLSQGLYGLILAILVLSVTTTGIIVNLLRGNLDVSCGCGGLEDEAPLSWGLVGRNLTLLAMLLVCFSPSDLRSLALFDTLTIIGGSLSVYFLYTVTSQLIANHPRLVKLRESLCRRHLQSVLYFCG